MRIYKLNNLKGNKQKLTCFENGLKYVSGVETLYTAISHQFHLFSQNKNTKIQNIFVIFEIFEIFLYFSKKNWNKKKTQYYSNNPFPQT